MTRDFFSFFLKKNLPSQYADPTDEPTAPFYDQTFEDYELSVEVWKGEVTWETLFKDLL